LAGAGYEVEILGAWLDAKLKARDQALLAGLPFQFTPVIDATVQTWAWLKSRVQVRMAKEWHQHTGRETHWQLGYGVGALARVACRRKADLFIAHSEPALFAAKWLIEGRGQRAEAASQKSVPKSGLRTPVSEFQIGVDMEDWFSEDLPAEARRQRPVKLLRSLEQSALCKGAYATCTSHAMSEALEAEYGCRPPAVIYNAFPWSDRQSLDGKQLDRRDRRIPSVHWYSQTLGTDRGLGDLFAALPLVKLKFEIHLRGKPAAGFEDWLATKVPETWRHWVFLHPLVSNEQLLSRIAEHDIGFAGEQNNISRNRDLTVTNKILHYLLGGLAVVASDTTGQKEIAAQANEAVRIYSSGDAASLAHELNLLLASPESLHSAKSAALLSAESIFCWERQAPLLLKNIRTVVK